MVYTLTDSGVLVAGAEPEVLWVFRRARRQWLGEWQRGERSSEFFYGLTALRARYRVGFVEDESHNPFRRPWYPVERLVARRIGMGFALDVSLRHLRALNRARVVISTVDSCGLPLALLKRVGALRSALVYFSQGLSDRVQGYGRDRWLSRWYRRLLPGVEELVTLGEGAQLGLARWLGIPSERVRVLPFGIDHEFWHAPPGASEIGNRIVSVGSDLGRDYTTLLAAAGSLPLHVVTRQHLPAGSHLLHTSEHTPVELRDIYARARFVVIPLHDRDQPSGQSAALQAMACGKAVVLARTRGWWGESFLQDGLNCMLVPPGDVDGLHRVLQELWSEPETCTKLGVRARETVVRHFTEARLAGAISDLVAPYLGHPTVVSRRSAC